ncbi:DUF115 domain-containing protein [Burkholderiaceae bacterium DAT-1]|nr:DUF115 domain-containing protein [Burkholderiaceae bacterium DAT-1]
MNNLGQAVIKRIEATYQANYLWLESAAPEVFQALEHPSQRTVDLAPDEKGTIQIVLNDPDFGRVDVPLAALWGATAIQIKEMEGPLRSVVRVNSTFDVNPDEASTANGGNRERSWLENIYGQDISRGPTMALRQAFAKIRPDEIPTYPQFGKGFIPILIVIGVGDGWQLERLIDRFDVRHLIVADYDPTGMKMAMCFTDFIGLADRCAAENRQLTLILERSPEQLAHNITSSIVKYWPPYFVHGAAFFHGVQVLEDTEQLKNRLGDAMRMVHIGWGFFEDELASLRHSWFNLRKNQFPICRRVEKSGKACRAIVCGAGPSLDYMIPFIKENQDEMVVISCGTALRALYRNGIKPDLHIEIERPASQIDTFKQQAPLDYLKSLTVVIPPLLYPEIANVAGEVLMLGKAKDTASHALLGDQLQFVTGPTVTNAAISLCSAFEFAEVVLCGVDYGWIDADKHHADDTIYHNDEQYQYGKQGATMNMAKWKPEESSIPVKGNFRDQVMTSVVFDAARRTAESVMVNCPATRFFNTADGAAMTGTYPLKLDNPGIKLRSLGGDKSAFMASFRSCFEQMDVETLDQRSVAFTHNVDAYIDYLLSQIPEQIDSREDLLGMLATLRVDREPDNPEYRAVWVAISGSLLVYFRLVYAMSCGLEEEAKIRELAVAAIENLKLFLSRMKEELKHWETWPEGFEPQIEHAEEGLAYV